jgi:hypothetical protein
LSRLWKCAGRKSARGSAMASPCVKARERAAFAAKDRLARVSDDPLLLMRRITPVSRGAALRAAGHRGRGSQPPGKGGGNAFAALTVGSRRFVKQSTLDEMLFRSLVQSVAVRQRYWKDVIR